jgi:hypothetical protein
MSKSEKKSEQKRYLSIAFSAGGSFAVSVCGGYFLGRYLDLRLETGTILSVIGTILGFVVGNLFVFNLFMSFDKKIK